MTAGGGDEQSEEILSEMLGKMSRKRAEKERYRGRRAVVAAKHSPASALPDLAVVGGPTCSICGIRMTAKGKVGGRCIQ